MERLATRPPAPFELLVTLHHEMNWLMAQSRITRRRLDEASAGLGAAAADMPLDRVCREQAAAEHGAALARLGVARREAQRAVGISAVSGSRCGLRASTPQLRSA